MGKQDGEFVSNERAQTTARVLSAVLFGIGLIAAFWVWPAGITNLTLANITLGVLLKAATSGAITLAALVMGVLLWIE